MSGQQLKYIRHSVAGIIVWPDSLECLSHRDVARVYGFSRAVCHGEILSAGFVSFSDALPICHGKSDSLGIKSHEDDTAALRAEWGMRCAVPSITLTPAMRADAAAIGACCDPMSLETGEPS